LKTILYLDQNHVSWLTKARLGVRVYPDVAAYYENLYDALREAVQANTIVCPASQFHYSESELDTRLAPEIYRTLEELYCGVEFRGFAEIVQAQAAAALRDFLGMPQPREAKWREAFSKDPHRRFGGKIEPIDRGAWGAFTDLSRYTKAFHERQGESRPVGGLEAQKRFEAREFVFNAYLLPFLNLARGATDMFTAASLDFLGRLRRTYRELLGRQATNEELIAFLRSKQMLSASFVDVYSYLRAAMALDRERKAKGSDLNDVLIAATVLPYCDVFATDGHMKHLIVALKLDKRYNVAVFGSRKADVLALTSLVREL
jgi:predicted nucleic acid-binding protein